MQNHNRDILIALILLALGFFSVLSYYPHGLLREQYNNGVYIHLIQDFPRSLTLRTEPLFIAIAWAAQKLTALPVAWVLIVLKSIILAVYVVLFYKICRLLRLQQAIAVTLTAILVTSASLFLMYDNLLRNFLGNALLLGWLYVWLKSVVQPPRSYRMRIILGSILLTLMAYTHLLPTLVVLTVLVVFCLIRFFHLRLSVFQLPSFQMALGMLGLGSLLILIPYFFVFVYLYTRYGTDLSLHDYQLILPLNGFSTLINANPFHIFLALFRFVFEYRDISLPLAFIPVILGSFLTLVWKRFRSDPVLIINILWLILYAGTKLDFFGIGVISYRFTLMLTLASLFLFGYAMQWLWSFIPPLTRKIIMIMVLALFFGRNLPTILEITWLRDYQVRALEEKSIAEWKEYLEHVEVNPSLLKTSDPLAAFEMAHQHKYRYIAVDDSDLQRKGSDVGDVVSYDITKFFNQRYFTQRIELWRPFSRLFVFSVNKMVEEGAPVTSGRELINIDVENIAGTQKRIQALARQALFERWDVLLNVDHDGSIRLEERIITARQEIWLRYRGNTSAYVSLVDIPGATKLTLALPPFERDQLAKTRSTQIVLAGGIMPLQTSQPILVKDLREYSYDQLRLKFEPSEQPLTIIYLNRLQFNSLVRSIILALAGIVIAALTAYWYFVKKDPEAMPVPVALLLMVMVYGLIFSHFFLTWYVQLL